MRYINPRFTYLLTYYASTAIMELLIQWNSQATNRKLL